MKFIVVCHECEGRGEYELYNAYELAQVDWIECEVCSGVGYLNTKPTTAPPIEELKN